MTCQQQVTHYWMLCAERLLMSLSLTTACALASKPGTEWTAVVCFTPLLLYVAFGIMLTAIMQYGCLFGGWGVRPFGNLPWEELR